MLRHLRVQNFAILSDVALDLGAGMNVLTGETGAGKSLIVEAVNLLRGGRASADIPRAGADQAVVEAIFDHPGADVARILSDAGLPDLGAELLVRRVIHRGGRSRTYVNGALTTAARLGELGQFLVDLSGQHQHQGLVDAKRHANILDAFIAKPELAEAMHECWASVTSTRAQRDALVGDERQRNERIDYLAFQLEELTQANLQAGEDQDLRAERDKLAAADKLESAARAAEELLYGGDGAAFDQLAGAARELDYAVTIDRSIAGVLDQIAEAQALVDSAAADLRGYADHLEGNAGRLAELEERLDQLHRLTRKHGPTVDDVLRRQRELAEELANLEDHDGKLAELELATKHAEDAARALATKLSAQRRRAAKGLEKDVRTYLAELGLKGAELVVSLTDCELGSQGLERVEFLLSANKGEPAKALFKVASGGELSRIMLAMKLALRRADRVDTYVFDEVDTGIGGVTADAVGRQIRAVADLSQVLCVTHLPQIAAFADVHFRVSKDESDGRTETDVSTLDKDARRDELARMLGGARVTHHARAHADELIAAARSTT